MRINMSGNEVLYVVQTRKKKGHPLPRYEINTISSDKICRILDAIRSRNLMQITMQYEKNPIPRPSMFQNFVVPYIEKKNGNQVIRNLYILNPKYMSSPVNRGGKS